MKHKTATLGMGLIATKGSAMPVSAPTESIKTPVTKSADITAKDDRTAVTVRLDKSMYRSLKMYGLEHEISNQSIIVDALKAHLKLT